MNFVDLSIPFQARIEASQDETKTKIDSLLQQVPKAHDEHKAQLEKRIAELKAEQKRRYMSSLSRQTNTSRRLWKPKV